MPKRGEKASAFEAVPFEELSFTRKVVVGARLSCIDHRMPASNLNLVLRDIRSWT
jgi:hypothetical protein